MVIDIHTHQPLSTLESYPQLRSYDLRREEFAPFCSVGLYPFEVVGGELVERLADVASCDFVAAIGETGIDKREQYRGSLIEQRELFGAHVEIANGVAKPLIIHQVRAVDEVLRVLGGARVPVIFHGFTGSAEVARQLIRRGYYLSFGAMLLSNERLQSLFGQVPLGSVFLETDAAAIGIRELYVRAAEIKQIDTHVLECEIEKNFYDTGLAATYRAIAGR